MTSNSGIIIISGMGEVPDNHKLARQLSVLEERMNTHQAEYRTDIARLAEQMAKRDAEMARRDTEAARRETRLIFAMIATVAIGLTVFGFVTA